MLNPMGEFEDLLKANDVYAESFSDGGFDGIARAGVLVITCMDSRIEPLAMLGFAASRFLKASAPPMAEAYHPEADAPQPYSRAQDYLS